MPSTTYTSKTSTHNVIASGAVHTDAPDSHDPTNLHGLGGPKAGLQDGRPVQSEPELSGCTGIYTTRRNLLQQALVPSSNNRETHLGPAVCRRGVRVVRCSLGTLLRCEGLAWIASLVLFAEVSLGHDYSSVDVMLCSCGSAS